MCSLSSSNGLGESGLVPPLANADFLEDIKALFHSIKYGIYGPIIVNGVEYNESMSPMGLDDDEVADVTNFIKQLGQHFRCDD